MLITTSYVFSPSLRKHAFGLVSRHIADSLLVCKKETHEHVMVSICARSCALCVSKNVAFLRSVPHERKMYKVKMFFFFLDKTVGVKL